MADIKVRVGQSEAIKVISTGAQTQTGNVAFSVNGGTANVSQIDVSGVSNLNNLNLTGIATFKPDIIGSGGIIIDAISETLKIGASSSITSSSITIDGLANFNALQITGVSTYVGLATFQNDLFVDGTLTAGLLDGGSF